MVQGTTAPRSKVRGGGSEAAAFGPQIKNPDSPGDDWGEARSRSLAMTIHRLSASLRTVASIRSRNLECHATPVATARHTRPKRAHSRPRLRILERLPTLRAANDEIGLSIVLILNDGTATAIARPGLRPAPFASADIAPLIRLDAIGAEVAYAPTKHVSPDKVARSDRYPIDRLVGSKDASAILAFHSVTDIEVYRNELLYYL